jgi:hypothetical protein
MEHIIEKIRVGEGHFLNAQDNGIEKVELPKNGGSISRIIMREGRFVETNKPVEVWYRGQSC